MASFVVTYNDKVLSDLALRIKKAPATILDVAEKVVPDVMQKELEPLWTEPREPTLPFVWSNDPAKNARARRWYFANKVRGNRGGRYARTHALANQWKKIQTARGQSEVSFTASNSTPGLDFVQGPSQVPSHQDSGWGRYDEVLPTVGEKVFKTLSIAWVNILD